ncbi:GNAT family N-acetyltransferase [Asaia bogorensis]|uniref:GNAT family N-acetyltransferase n=1 Tax=Asaia bogorensis TaxID=91915 RepID=UPI000EFC4010|nr:GNAT family N-acetyltransferase [Asaia bogorensis]
MTELRDATESDLPAILAITNDAIATSEAIWATSPRSLEERRGWMADRKAAGFPVIVAVEDGTILGFASYGPFRVYEGYARTVEHSIYVARAAQRKGIGRMLLEAITAHAEHAGMHVLIGAITASNTASIALHRAAGFSESTPLPQMGFKFGRWLDLVFMYRLFEEDGHSGLMQDTPSPDSDTSPPHPV